MRWLYRCLRVSPTSNFEPLQLSSAGAKAINVPHSAAKVTFRVLKLKRKKIRQEAT